ncbi:MAG TPA: hypothetical protein PKD64_00220 [Pirellulaceae bacterium]|nr:hypothetical protein [Pirellulaceae bacterium]HMO90595.1 hypothetical protein [Pirellulaceae bacterium]HMP67826.1 hypothetical protein [Pirellulaceae bacterium]
MNKICQMINSTALHVIIVLATSCGSFNALAQVTSEQQDSLQDTTKTLECPIVDFHVNQVPLHKVIQMIRNQVFDNLGYAPNFVIQDSAKEIVVPQLEVTGISVESLLDALVFVTDEKIGYSDESGWISIYIDEEPKEVLVFNLTGFASRIEALVEAVNEGLAFQQSIGGVTTKYHAGSELFFAKGTPQDLDLVRQIVGQFTGRSIRPSSGPSAGGGGGAGINNND